MYRAKSQGSTADKDGNQYRFDVGTLVDAPDGTLDHCSDLEVVKAKEVKKEPVQKTVEKKEPIKVKKPRKRKR